jgi:Bacterial membrane protein YfhO
VAPSRILSAGRRAAHRAVTVSASRTYAPDRPAPALRRRVGFTTREHAAALAIIAATTFVFFFPVARGETFSEVAARQQQVYPWAAYPSGNEGRVLHYDHADSFYPWEVFASRALRHGELPLWNPHGFGGAPFLANGQNGVLYPPRLALAYTISPTRVHDVLLATHMFLAGIAMFLLLGYVGLSFPSALVGGLAWMLNSFALAWQALENYTAVAVWLPAGALLAHAMVQRRSWLATLALALVLGLLFAGGNVLFVELAVVTVFCYAFALVVLDVRRDWPALAGHIARLSAAAALFVGLSAISLLPTLELSQESARTSLSYRQLEEFALSWTSLANVFKPPDFTAGDPYHHNLFAGTAVGLLALVGTVVGLQALARRVRRAALAGFAAVLATFAILYMLHTPVTFAANLVLPGLENLKPLARAAFLLQFALAVLAAYGLETVLRGVETPVGRRLARSRLLAGALVGAGVAALIVRFGIARVTFNAAFILSLAAAVALAVTFELLAPLDIVARIRNRVSARIPARISIPGALLVAAVAGSIVGQAWLEARYLMPHQPDRETDIYPSTPLIRYLEQRPGSRFLATTSAFRGSTPMLYRLRGAGGYESLLPRRIENYWRVVGDRVSPSSLASHPLVFAYHPFFELSKQRPELLARAGVDYVVTPPAETTRSVAPRGLELRYEGRDGRVFSVAGAFPRAYVVAGCEEVATSAAALERFTSTVRAPTDTTVILERDSLRRAGLPCTRASSRRVGTASVVDGSLNSLTVRVRGSRPGWLVVTDSWDDGWRATVDGTDAEVLPANYVQRAVRVAPGTHVVRFEYGPSSFRLGAVVSGIALAVALGGLGLLLRRKAVRRAFATGKRPRRTSADRETD